MSRLFKYYVVYCRGRSKYDFVIHIGKGGRPKFYFELNRGGGQEGVELISLAYHQRIIGVDRSK